MRWPDAPSETGCESPDDQPGSHVHPATDVVAEMGNIKRLERRRSLHLMAGLTPILY